MGPTIFANHILADFRKPIEHQLIRGAQNLDDLIQELVKIIRNYIVEQFRPSACINVSQHLVKDSRFNMAEIDTNGIGGFVKLLAPLRKPLATSTTFEETFEERTPLTDQRSMNSHFIVG